MVALSGTLFEGGFPMRLVLLILAAVAAFFVWDNLANKGAYMAQITRTIEQAENFQGLVRVTWN